MSIAERIERFMFFQANSFLGDAPSIRTQNDESILIDNKQKTVETKQTNKQIRKSILNWKELTM